MRKPVFKKSYKDKSHCASTEDDLRLEILEVEGLYYLYMENKGADQLHGYPKMFCTFAFAYAKSRFFHDTSQLNVFAYPVSLTCHNFNRKCNKFSIK